MQNTSALFPQERLELVRFDAQLYVLFAAISSELFSLSHDSEFGSVFGRSGGYWPC